MSHRLHECSRCMAFDVDYVNKENITMVSFETKNSVLVFVEHTGQLLSAKFATLT